MVVDDVSYPDVVSKLLAALVTLFSEIVNIGSYTGGVKITINGTADRHTRWGERKRGTQSDNYGQDILSPALKSVTEGLPLIRARRLFVVPARTPRKHRDRRVAQPEIEAQLKGHFMEMMRRLYGCGT